MPAKAAWIGETLRRLQQRCTHLPQSSMGLAIAYTLNLWPQLQVYTEDGRVGIDNNPVEPRRSRDRPPHRRPEG